MAAESGKHQSASMTSGRLPSPMPATALPDVATLAPVPTKALRGVTTGCFAGERGDWGVLIERAKLYSTTTVELSALSYSELPSLIEFLVEHETELAFDFEEVSVHAPAKQLPGSDAEVCEWLDQAPALVSRFILHPDVVRDWEPWTALGDRLVIENMDVRKLAGCGVDDLERIFGLVSEARFCLDLAHVATIDPSMQLASDLLDAFGDRLAEVHVSSVDAGAHHIPLTPADSERFAAFIQACSEVPWIYEAVPSDNMAG